MTGEVVNLRRARKSCERAEREVVAASNRILHGRSKVERLSKEMESARSERLLDGHRLASRDGDDA